jgi:hypothetical protein
MNELGAALGAALCAFETTLCGLDDGRGGFEVAATLSGLAVETVLLALSIINNSGLVCER